MRKILLNFLLIGAIAHFTAQQKPKEIEEVLIQGKFLSTPYKKVIENIAIISKEDIKNSPAKSIDEVLQQVAGIDVRKRGANGVQSDISIRGGTFDQVLILINGIRMNDSQTGHNSMNIPIDLENVQHIEVIKGPAARRFGNNAYAGVINIITQAKPGKNAKISAEGGDFQTYNLGISANSGNETFSQSFSANSASSEGYRHNTDYKINNVFYQNQLKIKNGSIILQAGFREKKFGANGFYASPKATEQYEEVQTSIVSLAYQQKFQKLAVNTNLYWRRGQDMYLFIRNNPSFFRNMHIGNNVGSAINFTYQSDLGSTGLGVEVKKDFLVSNNLGQRNRLLTQIFFEHHFSAIQNRLLISPGIHWANYNNIGNFFYPGLDVGFQINDENKIYANVAKVNRIPTFTDLYYRGRNETGNPNLKPEKAISSEIGYQFKNQNITTKISGFMRNSYESIDWIKLNIDDKWVVQNIGKLNLKGIEVELKHRPNKWLNYSLAYTYIDNKREISNKILSRYALENLKHQFIGKLNLKIFKYFTNELIYRYNQRLNWNSYHILDGKLSFKKENLNLYLLVNNITNTKYSDMKLVYVPMPNRWFHIGATYNIDFK